MGSLNFINYHGLDSHPILTHSGPIQDAHWQYVFLTFSLLPEHTLKKIVLIFLLKTTILLLFIKLLRATPVTQS